MKYKNRITGAVIDVKSRVSGGAWERVAESNEDQAQEKAPDPVQEQKTITAAKDKVASPGRKKTTRTRRT